MAARGLEASPISEILIEKSIAGWKEFELEVMRDRADNCVIICSIENVDPMGVHTGDSITVAPAQTLTDVEYQEMRDAAFACIRRVGVETGGSNVQFAVHPDTGEQVVIEMNPRVSRSSALASKATGFPIAKIAAKLAVGYTLDEIPNDITRKTPASFEPIIDYVVTKIPRWAFEKFPGAEPRLGTQMQSVGEVMAIGRTFPESLQKALRSLEQGRAGLNGDPGEVRVRRGRRRRSCWRGLSVATPERIFERGVAAAPGRARSTRCSTPPGSTRGSSTRCWPIVEERSHLESRGRGEAALGAMTRRDWRRAKRLGFGDAQLGWLLGRWPRTEVRAARLAAGVRGRPTRPSTPAAPSSRPRRRTTTAPTRTRPRSRRRAGRRSSSWARAPTGSGRASSSTTAACTPASRLADAGYETIMVNCNPETVSTDYDTSDRLYFEPLSVRGRAQRHRGRAALGRAGRRPPGGRHRRRSAARPR